MRRDMASTSVGLTAERETRTSVNDSLRDSGLPPPLPALSFDSGDLLLPEEPKVGAGGMSRLLTVGEVAALLNVPRKWVYRRVALKPPEGIPYVKIGKYLRFRESDLRKYVERLRRN